MLKKLNQLLAKLPRFLLPALCFILLFVVLSEPTLAEEKVPKTFLETLGGFEKIYSSVILVIVMLTYVFALMVGDLIDSTFILDTGMGETLHSVWSVVRNFVNIGFILILLVIAAMVVLGGAGDKGLGMLKKVLPKFILALVFVNFTFFAGRFILTTNDVLATAIFALPKTVAGANSINLPCPTGSSAKDCRDIIMATVTSPYSGEEEVGKDMKDKLTGTIQTLQDTMASHKIADTIDKKNVALLLVSSMLDLKNLVSSKGVLGGSWDTAISGIMAIITAGAVGIVIFMLMLALIVRMVVLWMCLALSPVAALAVVLGDVIPGASLKGDLDLLGIFIKHAFMPTLVSIPLSIGLIMIFTNNTIKPNSGGVLGSIGGAEGAGNFNSLLWWIASIIIIWFGVNTMIKKASPEFASKITDKIHGGVNKAAGTVAGTLKYAPILPAWNGGQTSLHETMAAPMAALEKVKYASEERARTEGNEMAKGLPSNWTSAPPVSEETLRHAFKTGTDSKRKGDGAKIFIQQATEINKRDGGAEALRTTKLDEETIAALTAAFGPLGMKADATYLDAIKAISERGTVESKEKADLANLVETIDSSANSKTPENQAKTEQETGVKSEVAGKTIKTEEGNEKKKVEDVGEVLKDNKKSPTDENNKVKIDGKVLHEVKVKDANGGEKTMYATQNDDNDATKGFTGVFTKEELGEYLGNIKARIKTANENTEMEPIAKLIADAKDKYGNLAMDQLKDIRVDDKKAKGHLKEFLTTGQRMNDADIKKILG